MANATFVIEIGFTASRVDVTADVVGINIKTGRQRVIDSFHAGTCKISLNNSSGKYTPLGDGTYSNSQFIGTEVRVLVTLNSASVPTCLFRGKIEDANAIFTNKYESLVELTCSDGFADLARTELNAVSFSSHVGSTRFTSVLDNASVDYPDEPGSPAANTPKNRDVNTSSITMASETVNTTNTLSYLKRLANSEDGMIFIRHGMKGGGSVTAGDKGNILTYTKRDQAPDSTGLTFGPSSATTATPPMISVKTSYGAELLFTKGVYQRNGGSDQAVTDTAGKAAYGLRTIIRRSLLNNNDSDVLGACENFVYRHAAPSLRVEGIVCRPEAMTEAQAEKVAKISIADGISVNFTPAGASGAITRSLRVEGVTHRITPKNWHMTINTSGVGETNYLLLDSTAVGLLNENRLAPG